MDLRRDQSNRRQRPSHFAPVVIFFFLFPFFLIFYYILTILDSVQKKVQFNFLNFWFNFLIWAQFLLNAVQLLHNLDQLF